LAAGLARTHEEDRLPVRGPGRLDVVGVSVRELLFFSTHQSLDEDLPDPPHFPGVQQLPPVGRPGGEILDALPERDLRQAGLQRAGRSAPEPPSREREQGHQRGAGSHGPDEPETARSRYLEFYVVLEAPGGPRSWSQ